MINANVLLWLIAGSFAGLLIVLQEHSSSAMVLGSFIAASMLLGLFNLIRRQPKLR